MTRAGWGSLARRVPRVGNEASNRWRCDMRIRMEWRATMLAVLALTCLPAWAHAVPMRHVVGNGGATTSGGSYVLKGTVGQPVVGMSSGSSRMVCIGFWCVPGLGGVSVDQASPLAPARFEIGPPAPNPSRGVVSMQIALPEAAEVRMAIYDVAGRLVGAVTPGMLAPGIYRIEWDGRAARALAGTGIFFARISLDGRSAGERKIVTVR